MNVSLHFTIFATFGEDETCNPALLIELRKYLDLMQIGYDIYKRKTASVYYEVQQIQIFGPAWLDSVRTLQLNAMLEKLAEPFDMVSLELNRLLPSHSPDTFEIVNDESQVQQIEINILPNREEIAAEKRQQNTVQTSLQFYDNGTITDSQISAAERKGASDPIRKSKSTRKIHPTA